MATSTASAGRGGDNLGSNLGRLAVGHQERAGRGGRELELTGDLGPAGAVERLADRGGGDGGGPGPAPMIKP